MQIKVKVFPKSGRSEVEGVRNGRYIVRLKSSPKKGKANKELLEVISEHFHIPKGNLRIKRGFTSRKKVVEVLFLNNTNDL